MPSPPRRRLLLPLLAVAALLGGGVATAQAAPLETVANTNDSGAGSLRQALVDVDAGGTVRFAGGLTGTITLTSGPLTIDKAMTVTGPGARRLAISGNDNDRVIEVGGSGDVELSGLTLTDGRAGALYDASGGALLKGGSGKLTVRDSRIRDSVAFTVIVGGPSGGGVAVADGELLLERSAVIGNDAGEGRSQGEGGGVAVLGGAAATLRDVTISGNRSGAAGGGLYVSSLATAVAVERTTIAGNEAATAGGGIKAAGPMTIGGSIVSANTAPAPAADCSSDAGVVVTVTGSILVDKDAGCTWAGGGRLTNVTAFLSPPAFNGPGETETMAIAANSPARNMHVVGEGTCTAGATDQRGVARPQGGRCDLGAFEQRAARPALTPAAHDFGRRAVGAGPTAPTAFTLVNDGDLGLAFDGVAVAGADADQFGTPTTSCPATLAPGASCPIEVAFDPSSEGAKSAVLSVDTGAGTATAALTGTAPPDRVTVTTLDDDGAGSLRAALANVAAGGTVDFDASLSGTVALTRQLRIEDGVTVDGPGAQRLTLSGGDAHRVLAIDTDGDVELSGLTVADGLADGSDGEGGAGILKDGGGRLTLRDSEVRDSIAMQGTNSRGGGMFVRGGELLLERTTFAGNEALSSSGSNGGAVFAYADAVTLRDVTLAGNTTTWNGYTIWYFSGAPVTIERSTIAGNVGRGIGATHGVVLADSIVSGNTHDCADAGGPLTLAGRNVIQNPGGCSFTGSGTNSTADPRLQPLALNAPGETRTMALAPGSPALDVERPGAGACTSDATDERGVPRPQGSGCDAGAFEARPGAAVLTPDRGEFGTLRAGSGPTAPQALTLANSDEADLALAVGTPALGGGDADQFTLDAAGCAATLAPGASCELSARFAPTRAGALSATVEAAGASAALSGTAYVPTLGAEPRALAFGAQQVGTTSAPKTIAMRAGGGPVAVAQATVTGPFAIAQDGCRGRTLDPDEQCELAVTFAPKAAGAARGTLTVPSDAGPPVEIALGGEATAVPVDPPPAPPAPPAPRPVARAPKVEQFALARRCVRPSRGGTVKVGLRLRLSRAARVRVQVARAIGTGGLRRCPARGSGTFDGDFAKPITVTRGSTPAATVAALSRSYALTLRLRPALYRITVRPYTGARSLGRPVHRYLRVLAR